MDLVYSSFLNIGKKYIPLWYRNIFVNSINLDELIFQGSKKATKRKRKATSNEHSLRISLKLKLICII